MSSLLSCWCQLSKVAKQGSSSCCGTFPGLTSFAFEYEIRRESTLVAHHSQPCPSPTHAPKKPHGDLHLAAQSMPNPHPSQAMALLWHNKWWYLSCFLSCFLAQKLAFWCMACWSLSCHLRDKEWRRQASRLSS